MKSLKILVMITFFAICSGGAFPHGRYIKFQNSEAADSTSPTTRIINITGHHGKKLILTDQLGDDASKLKAYDNDIIIWNNRDTDITIIKTKQKHLRKNRFLDMPALQKTSGTWSATIQDYKGKSRKEHYFIKWEYNTNGKKRKYDPLIPINPKRPIDL